MSNSPLVTYTKLSPDKSTRKSKIDSVIIHCIVGQWTAQQGCDYFASSERECSANYVVGKDGSIGLSVEEKYRAWCSGGTDEKDNPIRVNGISGADFDHRAIAIEVASDTKHPYAVTDKAYAALIDLLVDICKRNNIPALRWKGDKSYVGKTAEQNMGAHRWFAYKACPGDYLYNKHAQIAAEVNKRLGSTTTSPQPEKPATGDSGTLKVGNIVNFTGFKHYTSANAAKGVSVKPCKAKVTQVYKKGKHPYHVRAVNQLGAFTSGVYGWVDAADLAAIDVIKVGSKVKVLKAITYTGKPFKTYYDTYDVIEVKDSRVVIGIGKTVTCAININNIELA